MGRSGDIPHIVTKWETESEATMNRTTWSDRPLVSGALVAINVLVFLACSFTGDLLYGMGRMTAYHVLQEGEYGRILWAMFLHGDVGHIFNNMLLLFFMGAMIEKEIGHVSVFF